MFCKVRDNSSTACHSVCCSLGFACCISLWDLNIFSCVKVSMHGRSLSLLSEPNIKEGWDKNIGQMLYRSDPWDSDFFKVWINIWIVKYTTLKLNSNLNTSKSKTVSLCHVSKMSTILSTKKAKDMLSLSFLYCLKEWWGLGLFLGWNTVCSRGFIYL